MKVYLVYGVMPTIGKNYVYGAFSSRDDAKEVYDSLLKIKFDNGTREEMYFDAVKLDEPTVTYDVMVNDYLKTLKEKEN